MMNRDEPDSPAWHKRRAHSYLIAFAFLLVLLSVGLIPAAPLFLKMFVPYPALAEAEHWQGTVHVQGKLEGGPRGGVRLPRYFIDTPQGRKEFMCGVLGHRVQCNGQHLLDGAKGDVWYHPLFGTLQERYSLTSGHDAGRSLDVPYLVLKNVFDERFNHGRYLGNLAFSLIPFAGAIISWHRYRKHRAAARAAAVHVGKV